MEKYTLTLSDEQLAVINAGLQELPMKFAGPVVADINRQLREALAAAAAAHQPEETP